jgi:uncharacterized protein
MSLSRRWIAGAIIVATFALTPALAPALADVKAGVDAWQRGNYTAAIAEWRPLAEKGDPDAQFNMGQAYKLGRGVPTDLKMAQSWYEKAARQNHEEAQANLGLIMFQTGQQEAAMGWIRKAAARGDPRAEFVLATALFNGDSIEKDLPRAYALMSHAAAQGLLAATTSLAEMENVMPEADRQQGMKIARELLRKDAERVASTTASTASPSTIARQDVPAPKLPASKTPTGRTGLPTPPQDANNKPLAAGPSKPTAPSASPIKAASVPPQAKAGVTKQAAKTPAATATAALVSSGGRWRVQFGAYGSMELAKGQWSMLSKKISALAALKPSYEPVGALTRLRINSLADRSAAEKLCAAAKTVGQACFAIAP